MSVDFTNYIVVREDHKSTRRLYKTTCDNCGIDTGYKRKRAIVSNLCRTCFGQTKQGTSASEDTRLKMSRSQLLRSPNSYSLFSHTKETRDKLSKLQREHCAVHGNQFLTGHNKGQHSQEVVLKLSEANIGKEPRWKGRIFLYDGPRGIFKMRSSYELAYAKYLDVQGVVWEYEPKFKLSNGKWFCPDFKLADGLIIEVKGFWTEKAKEKWALFKADNPELHTQVIMKQDLLRLGLEIK
jgi:predicted nuclease of restriction endonuclease-like RecB superfamily